MTSRWMGAAVLLLLAMTTPVSAQHFPSSEDLRRVLRFVVEDGPAPGVVLGALERDGTISVIAHGTAGAGAPQLVPNSTFEIGSITKTFTATLLALMVLQGEVGLEDPVGRYLPDSVTVPSVRGREITLLDLATHRSGLPNTPPEMQVGVIAPASEYSHEDAYRFLATYELAQAPGESANYSNFGYALLGHALSNAAGQSYEELITSRILEPLGMRDTGFVQDSTGATWTRGSRGGAPVRFRTSWPFVASAGALYSSARDLLRYLAAHVSPQETQLQQAMRMAYEVRFPDGPGGVAQGLAWSVGSLPGESPVVSHSGTTVGYRAEASFMPDEGTATVLLANSADFNDNIGTTLLLPEPPPAEWLTDPPSESELRRYVGEYRAQQGDARFTIDWDPDGYLTYRPADRPRTPLFPRSGASFYLLRAPITVTFAEGADGRMTMEMAIDEREPAQQRTIQRAIRTGG